MGSNLVKLGIISDDVITTVLSRQYGVPSINLELFQIDADTVKLISQEVALKYSVLPISKVGATLTVTADRPEHWTDALQRLKKEPELRTSLSLNGREAGQEFAPEVIRRQFTASMVRAAEGLQ